MAIAKEVVVVSYAELIDGDKEPRVRARNVHQPKFKGIFATKLAGEGPLERHRDKMVWRAAFDADSSLTLVAQPGID